MEGSTSPLFLFDAFYSQIPLRATTSCTRAAHTAAALACAVQNEFFVVMDKFGTCWSCFWSSCVPCELQVITARIWRTDGSWKTPYFGPMFDKIGLKTTLANTQEKSTGY